MVRSGSVVVLGLVLASWLAAGCGPKAARPQRMTGTEALQDPEYLEHWRSANGLGTEGRYREAIPAMQDAIAVLIRHVGSDDPALVLPLTTLGKLYGLAGHHTLGRSTLERALAIGAKHLGPDHEDIITAVIALAEAYDTLGQYDEAEALYKRVVAVLERRPEHNAKTLALVYNDMGILYQAKEDLDQAERFSRRGIAIAEKAHAPELASDILGNLAVTLKAQGKLDEAEALYKRVLETRKRLGPAHPSVLTTEFNLAALYADTGRNELARPIFERQLGEYEKLLGPNHPRVADTLSRLSKVAVNVGDHEKAVTHLRRALDIREINLAVVLASGSEAQKQAAMRLSEWETNRAISLHLYSAPDSRAAAELASRTLLQRKGRVLDAQADVLQSRRERMDATSRQLLDRLLALRSQHAQLIFDGVGRGGAAAFQNAVRTLEQAIEKAEVALAERTGGIRVSGDTVTLAKVRDKIPEGAALVEFVTYTPVDYTRAPVLHYAAYVLSAADLKWVDLGATAPIDTAIAALRTAIVACPARVADGKDCDWQASETEVKRVSRALYDRVFEPIRPLVGNAAHLLISADGAVNLVPFGALVDRSGRYLVQQYALTNMTSGRDLLRLARPTETRSGSVVIMADPDYAKQEASDASGKAGTSERSSILSGVKWPRLPGTAAEARAIGALLDKPTLLLQEWATESSLKQMAAPRVLHVATHGFFLADAKAHGDRALKLVDSTTKSIAQPEVEDPLLRSGLVLAGANARRSGAEDGIVTASEVSGLDLLGTELVVLSACETGVGEVRNGDGVYGLRRALVLAGARSQVMSLWQVSDAATSDLMSAYYGALKAGQGRTAALQAASIKLLTTTRWSHPYFWAAFIPSGDWRPLRL